MFFFFVRLMRYYVVPKVNYLSFQAPWFFKRDDMIGSHDGFPLKRWVCNSQFQGNPGEISLRRSPRNSWLKICSPLYIDMNLDSVLDSHVELNEIWMAGLENVIGRSTAWSRRFALWSWLNLGSMSKVTGLYKQGGFMAPETCDVFFLKLQERHRGAPRVCSMD